MRWLDKLESCFTAHWKLKARLSAVLTLAFCVPYFALQRVILLPVRTLTPSPIDHAIAFDPRWVWVYQSAYLLLAIVPWLADLRDDLARYARGFALLSSLGFAGFLVFPVAAPRPAVVPTDGMFGWLVWYDGPTNAFPSLHVGLASYTLLFGARASKGRLAGRSRVPLVTIGAAWAAAIAYAALATKQHFAIDLPAGVLVAWLSHLWVWRDASLPAAAPPVRIASSVPGRPSP